MRLGEGKADLKIDDDNQELDLAEMVSARALSFIFDTHKCCLDANGNIHAYAFAGTEDGWTACRAL
jgi:hypothetical protein